MPENDVKTNLLDKDPKKLTSPEKSQVINILQGKLDMMDDNIKGYVARTKEAEDKVMEIHEHYQGRLEKAFAQVEACYTAVKMLTKGEY